MFDVPFAEHQQCPYQDDDNEDQPEGRQQVVEFVQGEEGIGIAFVQPDVELADLVLEPDGHPEKGIEVEQDNANTCQCEPPAPGKWRRKEQCNEECQSHIDMVGRVNAVIVFWNIYHAWLARFFDFTYHLVCLFPAVKVEFDLPVFGNRLGV